MKLSEKTEHVLRIPSSQLDKNKSLKPCLHCQLKPNFTGFHCSQAQNLQHKIAQITSPRHPNIH